MTLSPVMAVFRDEPSLQAALAELAAAGLEQDRLVVRREQEPLAEGSPGNDETLIAQNQAGFAALGGFLSLVLGLLVALLAGWLRLDNPVALLVPLGCGLLGRLLGGWLGGFFRFGLRESEGTPADVKLLLQITPSSLDERKRTVRILKRHAAGAGTPLV